ncbi:MAG TPA: peptidylprolyl isomerase [Candidatus Cloacimonas sp.]|nr:peptidylprolyl isomerase [Candidatus Cloacimonas sp.]
MQIVAKVIEFEISRRDLERECAKLNLPDNQQSLMQALERLIDRCLLLSQANQLGIEISDEEYDAALLELIEEDEPFGLKGSDLQVLTAQELEILLRRRLTIKKYVQVLCPDSLPLTTDKLREFYNENKEFFVKPQQVHCAHILIRGLGVSAKQKAETIRSEIKNERDFADYCMECSECPSSSDCGDLGWFERGKMLPEIDKIAFSLQLGEISQPFTSQYGYHILMLLDKREPEYVPFEEIKDSLYARLQQIEKEYLLSKHVSELRSKFAQAIVIFRDALEQA